MELQCVVLSMLESELFFWEFLPECLVLDFLPLDDVELEPVTSPVPVLFMSLEPEMSLLPLEPEPLEPEPLEPMLLEPEPPEPVLPMPEPP